MSNVGYPGSHLVYDGGICSTSEVCPYLYTEFASESHSIFSSILMSILLRVLTFICTGHLSRLHCQFIYALKKIGLVCCLVPHRKIWTPIIRGIFGKDNLN